MILFLENSWYLWWVLAMVLAVRWFHALSSRNQLEAIDVRASEEEQAYIVSWQILHKAQAISLLKKERAF